MLRSLLQLGTIALVITIIVISYLFGQSTRTKRSTPSELSEKRTKDGPVINGNKIPSDSKSEPTFLRRFFLFVFGLLFVAAAIFIVFDRHNWSQASEQILVQKVLIVAFGAVGIGGHWVVNIECFSIG